MGIKPTISIFEATAFTMKT